MSPEVLIYIKNVRTFFKNNQKVRDYFLSNIDEELFFEYLKDISQKNYEKNGEAMLSPDQFEILKKTLRAISIAKETYPIDNHSNIFFEIKGYGLICLN